MKSGNGNTTKKGGNKMKVIRYDKQYKQEFIDLNKHWIDKFFNIEPHDLEQLENVAHYLEQGGMIFFAIDGEQVLSTCMVIELQPDIWEICKFATNEKFQGKGADKAVFAAALDYAKDKLAKKKSFHQ